MNIKKNYSKKRHQSYASAQAHAAINGLIGVIAIAFISFYFFLTPLNPQSIAFWLTLIIALFVFAALKSLTICSAAAERMQDQAAGQKTWKDICRHEGIFFILPLIAIIALLLIALSGSPVFSSHKYAAILNVRMLSFLMIYLNLSAQTLLPSWTQPLQECSETEKSVLYLMSSASSMFLMTTHRLIIMENPPKSLHSIMPVSLNGLEINPMAYLAMLQLIQCPCRPPMYNAASR